MKTYLRILYFFILPIVAVLLYPPKTFESGLGVILVAVLFMVMLGVLILRGRNLALTFAIFLQGLNVIVRMMMFWNNGFTKTGVADALSIITNLLGIGLSIWLLFRLDRQDIRIQMTR